MLRAIFISAFVLGLATPIPVLAQTGADSGRYVKEQRFSFEDDEVTAQIQRPDGPVVRGVRRAPTSLLIEMRQSFLPELVKSAEGV